MKSWRIPSILLRQVNRRMVDVVWNREPDFVIGAEDDPYLERWHLIPRNRFLNVYLHRFCRSDDDRALHDHPWPNVSILLAGTYVEHTIAPGGIHVKVQRRQGQVKARSPGAAHRLELVDGECWSLFITGPKVRDWGFHCPEAGWIHWRRFTDPDSKGRVGPGCGA